MAGLIDKLSVRGYKNTPQRRLILQALADSPRPLTAEAIAAQAGGISVATVYRNINLMITLGIASKLDLHGGPARYALNQGHNHHLICLGCGNVVKLDICPMRGKVNKIIAEHGFQVDGHHFEITGYCRECQARRGQ